MLLRLRWLLWAGLLGSFAVEASQAQWTYERYSFRRFVGNSAGPGSVDGEAQIARFRSPRGVAVDQSGNVYVADTLNATIRKISPSRIVTTLAGSPQQLGNADGSGGDARFTRFSGITVDRGGTIYVADPDNHTIRKITPAGVVTTLAGLAGSMGSVDGVGSEARFGRPPAIAVDDAYNLYVTDVATVRKISPAGVVTTLAGKAGSYAIVDGTGSDARFNNVFSLAVDGGGNVFVGDSSTIRKVSPEGIVTTIAGSATETGTADGPANEARFRHIQGVTVDRSGVIYATDGGFPATTIRRLTPDGRVTTIAGNAHTRGGIDGPGDVATFGSLAGITVDAAGDLYIADSDNHAIRKVARDFTVTTFAGVTESPGYADGTGFDVRFNQPTGLAFDRAGDLYVADSNNHLIRKVTGAGVVSTVAGTPRVTGSADGTGRQAQFKSPTGVAVDTGGAVYVTDSGNFTVRKITPEGIVTTLAGLPGSFGTADGVGSAARFVYPTGIAIDSAGNLFVADSFSNVIRKITPAGLVTTFAGKPSNQGASDSQGFADGVGSFARFYNPFGITIDAADNLFVADRGNNAIRKITPAAVVTTVVRGGTTTGSADGASSIARFYHPEGIAVDSAGILYVSDTSNHTVRKVTQDGTVTTIGGKPGVTGTRNGAGRAAEFSFPRGLAVDTSGKLYLADSNNHMIHVAGPTAIAQPLNISTRVHVQTGEKVLIGGFITAGSIAKQVIVRAVGPSLGGAGVQDVLADPVLELRGKNGEFIASNDNWRDWQEAAIRETGIAPANEREAAIVMQLAAPGVYTASVRGANGGTGTALVEIYDLNQTAGSTLANISTRGFVQTADRVMIGGFILGGANGATGVLIRAIGPSLNQAGISDALADPTLTLRDANGALLASNDNWKETHQMAIEATGAAPTHEAESAIVASLPAGSYTAIVSGSNGGIGVSVVEVYNID